MISKWKYHWFFSKQWFRGQNSERKVDTNLVEINFQKKDILFLFINLKSPAAQNSFPKHRYYARTLFILSFVNITLRKRKKEYITWSDLGWASIWKKFQKIQKIQKILTNFQNTNPFFIDIIQLYAHLRSIFDNNRSPLIDRSPWTNHIINLKK